MLIAARESFAAAARKRLPYDAEVQYLQSSGTQYIDTQCLSTKTMTARIRYESLILTGTASNGLFGARVSSLNGSYLVMQYNSSGLKLRADYAKGARDIAALASGVHVIEADGNYFSLDGGTPLSVGYKADFPAQGLSVWLFAVNQNGSPLIRHTGLRVYEFSLGDNGTALRDYIPVRVGSGSSAVGYMYDKVSGTLFGNAGTGLFTVGPDKTA